MYIGYARVSKEYQNLDLQKEALERMAAKKIIKIKSLESAPIDQV